MARARPISGIHVILGLPRRRLLTARLIGNGGAQSTFLLF